MGATFEDVKNELLGKIISVTGRVTQNEMFARKEFVVQFVNSKPDPKKEMERLDTLPKEEVKEEAPKEIKEEVKEPKEETEEVVKKEVKEAPVEEEDLSEELMSLDELEPVDDEEDIYS